MKRQWWYVLGISLAFLFILGFFMRSPEDEVVALFAEPETGSFAVNVTTTGELRAKNSVNVYGPRRAQQLRIYEMKISRLIPEGTVVEKGDFVAELDRSEVMSQIKDAEIELQKAEALFTQSRLDTALTLSEARDELQNLEYALEEAKLRNEQSVYEPPSVQRQAEIAHEKAQRDLERNTENYKTRVQQAAATMSEATAELSLTRKKYTDLLSLSEEFIVTAPENGMLIYDREWGGQRKEVGSTVRSWDPVVATLPDLSVMETVTYVNEVDIQKIKQGLSVQIGLDAMPDEKLTGTVTRVANIGEQRPGADSKVFEVTIQINETDSTLRPAMTTSNIIHIARFDSVMYVPLETLHTADSLNFVYVRDGGSSRRQEIWLGMFNENEAIVEAGLEGDERLYLSIPPDAEEAPLALLDPDLKAELKARAEANKRNKARPPTGDERPLPADVLRQLETQGGN